MSCSWATATTTSSTFPTIEALTEGGYGTEPYVAPAEAGAGERIIDRALIHLYQMRGLLPPG